MTQAVAVTLGSDIVYVYGTVNSEAVSWQFNGSAWQTTVPRSQDGIYSIELTAWDAAGNPPAAYSVTLRYGLSLITDRTQADVNRAAVLSARVESNITRGREAFSGFTEAELAAWAGLKGAYNAADLNRVEDAVRFLADLLHGYGYTASVRFRSKDWIIGEDPTESELTRYLGNVRALIDAFHVLPTTPKLPGSVKSLTFEGANAIERVLQDVYYLIQNISASYTYSGENYAGE